MSDEVSPLTDDTSAERLKFGRAAFHHPIRTGLLGRLRCAWAAFRGRTVLQNVWINGSTWRVDDTIHVAGNVDLIKLHFDFGGRP